jgi:hypothetical protein
MMRIETVTGVLYYGDVFFGDTFVRVVPNRILVYSREANGYMELENYPKELFIPVSRIEVVAQIDEEPLGENDVVTEEELAEAEEALRVESEASNDLENEDTDEDINPNTL